MKTVFCLHRAASRRADALWVGMVAAVEEDRAWVVSGRTLAASHSGGVQSLRERFTGGRMLVLAQLQEVTRTDASGQPQ